MPQKITRREFLHQSVYFSAFALLASRNQRLDDFVDKIQPEPGSHHFFALGDWGEESSHGQQRSVARAMRDYANKNNLKVENLLLLGDNWYGWLFGGADSSRWKSQFEEMYPSDFCRGKCYAVLGNHDYEYRPGDKVKAQLEYAKKLTRWTMPSKWYSFTFPESEPLIRFIALDSNYPNGAHFYDTPTLRPDEVAAQRAWLNAELEKPCTTPFTSFIAHHPLFSNGDHGDTPAVIRDWQPLLQQRHVHLYLSGHDHDLQHLEFEGNPTSYVISGGGGATLRNLKQSPATRGPYGLKVAGFTHIEVNKQQMIVRHVDITRRILHCFRKYPDGSVVLE
ncbi:MAG TPA: metallophosphoesterase [Acidobacteriaceae bacterium]